MSDLLQAHEEGDALSSADLLNFVFLNRAECAYEFDFVKDFATVLPVFVITEMLAAAAMRRHGPITK